MKKIYFDYNYKENFNYYEFLNNHLKQNGELPNLESITFIFDDLDEVSTSVNLFLEYYNRFKKERKIIYFLKLNILSESFICLQPSFARIYGQIGPLNLLKRYNFLFNEWFANLNFAHLHNSLDNHLQKERELYVWEYKKVAVPNYAKLIPKFDFDDKNAKQIDLESLPGHTHSMGYDEGLWFGACYQMYFSEIYYKYIPKSLFDAFTDCFENIILDSGVRKITLYENPDDYDLPDSRRRQFEFRKQLGIDTIGHELTMPVDLFIDDNLPVYITKKNIAEGQTKVIRYLDATKNLVIKKKASFKETKIYLEDGVTVVFEQLEKKNFFGNFV